MNRALITFLIDAVYVVLYFLIMTAAASGVGFIVKACEAAELDPAVILILKALEIGLAAIDASGVIIVAVLLMGRFIRSVATVEGKER